MSMRNMFEREDIADANKNPLKDLELHQVHSNCSVNVRLSHYYNIHYFLLYCIVIWVTALLSNETISSYRERFPALRVCDPYKHLIQFLQWNPYPLIDSFNIAIEQMVAFESSDGHLGFFLYSKYTLSIFILTFEVPWYVLNKWPWPSQTAMLNLSASLMRLSATWNIITSREEGDWGLQ